MPNQESENTQSDTSRAYRGTMVYCHEDGYKLATMQVHLLESEQSSVITDAYSLPIVEHEAQVPYDWQAAYDEALYYYKDSIPVWLNIQNKLDTTAYEPFDDDESDFGLESRRKP